MRPAVSGRLHPPGLHAQGLDGGDVAVQATAQPPKNTMRSSRLGFFQVFRCTNSSRPVMDLTVATSLGALPAPRMAISSSSVSTINEIDFWLMASVRVTCLSMSRERNYRMEGRTTIRLLVRWVAASPGVQVPGAAPAPGRVGPVGRCAGGSFHVCDISDRDDLRTVKGQRDDGGFRRENAGNCVRSQSQLIQAGGLLLEVEGPSDMDIGFLLGGDGEGHRRSSGNGEHEHGGRYEHLQQ